MVKKISQKVAWKVKIDDVVKKIKTTYSKRKQEELELRRSKRGPWIPEWLWQPLFAFQTQKEVDRNILLCKEAARAAKRQTNINKARFAQQMQSPRMMVSYIAFYYLGNWEDRVDKDISLFGSEEYYKLSAVSHMIESTKKDQSWLLRKLGADGPVTLDYCKSAYKNYILQSYRPEEWGGSERKTKKARENAFKWWRIEQLENASNSPHAVLLSCLIASFELMALGKRLIQGLEKNRHGPVVDLRDNFFFCRDYDLLKTTVTGYRRRGTSRVTCYGYFDSIFLADHPEMNT